MAYTYLQRKANLIPSEKQSVNLAALCNAKVKLNRIFLGNKKAKIDMQLASRKSEIHMLQQKVSIARITLNRTY